MRTQKPKKSLGFTVSIAGLFVGYWLAVWGDGTLMSVSTLIGAAAGAFLGLLVGVSLDL
jgi:hypothetical protein